jgi:hypothetical protein
VTNASSTGSCYVSSFSKKKEEFISMKNLIRNMLRQATAPEDLRTIVLQQMELCIALGVVSFYDLLDCYSVCFFQGSTDLCNAAQSTVPMNIKLLASSILITIGV